MARRRSRLMIHLSLSVVTEDVGNCVLQALDVEVLPGPLAHEGEQLLDEFLPSNDIRHQYFVPWLNRAPTHAVVSLFSPPHGIVKRNHFFCYARRRALSSESHWTTWWLLWATQRLDFRVEQKPRPCSN